MAKNFDVETDVEYTPSYDLYNAKAHDSTIEIVGFVDAIEATKVVGAQGYTIFKFFVNNDGGDRVQIITWNQEIKNVEPLIRINYIVHIDGAYCKPSLNKKFNKGTVDYELIIQSNTTISVLGKHNIEAAEDLNPELVDIGDTTLHTKCIKINGFVKSRFAVIKKQSGKGREFTCGSITDGEYKLEVHVQLNSDDENQEEFEKGDHVELVGFIQANANPIYFSMKNLKDIKKIDNEKMELKQLLRGNKNVEKRVEEPREHVVKKLKINN